MSDVMDGLIIGVLAGLVSFGILVRIHFGTPWEEFWTAFRDETRD